MRIDLRGGNVGMTQHFLDSCKPRSILQKVCGKGVPESMGCDNTKACPGSPSRVYMTPNNLPGPGSTESSAVMVEEDRSIGVAPILIRARLSKVSLQCADCTPAKWYEALPLSLSLHDRQPFIQAQIPHSKSR